MPPVGLLVGYFVTEETPVTADRVLRLREGVE
jgi:hypothetical protein